MTTNPDRSLQRPFTEAEVREVRLSMALQALTMTQGPLRTRQDAINTIVLAWARDQAEGEQLLQDLLAVGFVTETANGIEITNQGYLELYNRFRYPMFQQPYMLEITQLRDRMARDEATNSTTSSAIMRELTMLDNGLKGVEADLGRVKSEYMRRDYWTAYIFPILLASTPALIVGAVFYLIAFYAPHH